MTRQICPYVLAASLALFVSVFSCQGTSLKADGLKCEYQVNPLGLDTPRPRLSWLLESPERGQRQTAYQVLAATSPALLSPDKADLWDSGKVSSGESVHVVYGGKPLRPGAAGLLETTRVGPRRPALGFQPGSLVGDGATGARGLARGVDHPQAGGAARGAQAVRGRPGSSVPEGVWFEKKLRRARVYVSGLGYYELRLNGQRVGDHVLDPGWTTYSKRVLYSTYDVTDQLKRGPNALGVMFGNGWFNPLPLRLWGHINPRQN